MSSGRSCGDFFPGPARPRTPRYLFVRTKRYQKAAGGGPPVPPASPSGRYFIYCLFALCCSWADSTGGACPSSAALQRLSTGSNGGYAKAAGRANPVDGPFPLRGRQVCSGLRPLATLRACLTSPRARLGGIFSALTALKILAIRQDCCGFLPCRAKNLSRQSAHAEILNRLLCDGSRRQTTENEVR